MKKTLFLTFLIYCLYFKYWLCVLFFAIADEIDKLLPGPDYPGNNDSYSKKIESKISALKVKKWVHELDLMIDRVPDSFSLFSDKSQRVDPQNLTIQSFKQVEFKVKFYVAMEPLNIRWYDLHQVKPILLPKSKIEALGGTPLDHNELVALCLAHPGVVDKISIEYKQNIIAIGSQLEGAGSIIPFCVARVNRFNPYIEMAVHKIKQPFISLEGVANIYSPGTIFPYKIPC